MNIIEKQGVGGITFFSLFHHLAIFTSSRNFCKFPQFHRIKLHKYPAYSIACFKKTCRIIKDFCPQQSQKNSVFLEGLQIGLALKPGHTSIRPAKYYVKINEFQWIHGFICAYKVNPCKLSALTKSKPTVLTFEGTESAKWRMPAEGYETEV